jgi:hypothetical protein
MAGIKISALPPVPSALLTDFLPVVQNGVTSQESLEQILTEFEPNITSVGMQIQALNMGGFAINALATPTLSTDAATKGYVDQNALTSTKVVAATTGALTVTQSGAGIGATLTNAGAQATFTIDGQSPSVGQNVLIKNQATNTQNGIYTVTNVGSGSTNWILTRATSYDTPAEINNTGLIAVTAGTTLIDTAWLNSTQMVTVDTTAVIFVQFGQSLSAATKAQQEAASSNTVFVTPANQQYHPSAVQVWCKFTVSGGACTLVAFSNVSSVSYVSAGHFTVNLMVPFATTNFAVLASGSDSTTTIFVTEATSTASAISLACVNAAGVSFVDPSNYVAMCAFGIQ